MASYSSVRVELNSANIRAFLKSPEMANALRPFAERIKAAADAGSGGGHEVRVLNGRDRVSMIITAVTPKARVAEIQNRNLTRALEAGRG